jgi:hypothetical protein
LHRLDLFALMSLFGQLVQALLPLGPHTGRRLDRVQLGDVE